MRPVRSVAIAGAGLAGLATAVALRDDGFDGRLVIVDGKRRFADDRTWCWWDVPGVPFADRASRRWNAWTVDAGARAAPASSAQHPYLHLRAVDYYRAALERLSGRDVELALGERVERIDDDRAGARVVTNARDLRADLVVDARGERPPTALRQHFYGIHVVTEEPVFDATTVTLMDFHAHRAGLGFFYVLPFSPRDALVEHAVVDGRPFDAAEHRRQVEAYLRDRYGVRRWHEARTEAGSIALGAERVDVRPSPHVVRAGVAAGATRASSGYAYVRTHRHARAIAAFVARGAPLRCAGSAWHRLLDGIMLAVVRGERVDVPALLTRVFAEVDGDALARFLSDAATWADEAAVIASVAAALPSALRRRQGAPLRSAVPA